MPKEAECVHLVDFDDFEILHKKRHKHEIRVGCKMCHGAVTLDDVLRSLADQSADLDARVRKLEGKKESDDVESVPDS